jgi:hypothetical protein
MPASYGGRRPAASTRLPSTDLHDLTTGEGGGKLPIVDPSAVEATLRYVLNCRS